MRSPSHAPIKTAVEAVIQNVFFLFEYFIKSEIITGKSNANFLDQVE